MWSIFVLSVLLFQNCLGDLIVQIENGKVEGTTINTPSGRKFYAWRGIPYGKPPVGDLRYLAPQKAEPWDGILDASKDSPACVFFGTFGTVPTIQHSEDCLYINVYSPVPVGSNSSVDKKYPVMFWIYGGGFSSGSGDFVFIDPTPLLEEDVIVVTFNYRLGTFGFLSTEDEVILGNAGLKDQVLALQWTRENIARFGGNPLEITLFGESAGSGSIGFHIVSPVSRNLFKAAIMESGSPLYNGFQTGAREFAYNLASEIDSSITIANTSAEIRNVLQAADENLIIDLTRLSGKSVGPIVEIKSNFSFLSTLMYESLETGDIARVPTIMGYNSEESIIFITDIPTAKSAASKYDSNPELLVPPMRLKENASAKAIGEEIRQDYVGKDGYFADNLAAYLDWISDNNFLRSIHKQAILQCKYSPVYMYQFSYYGTLSKNHTVVPGAGKVGHTDELGYLFNSTESIVTDEDYLTRKRFVKLWTNFVKTSNPTPDDDSAELLQNVKWEPITQDNLQYLDIDIDLQMKPNRKVNKIIFWDSIWNTYSYRPYNTY